MIASSTRPGLCLLVILALAGCGPGAGEEAPPADDGDGAVSLPDEDRDGIPDQDEGAGDDTDTDADGIPDWRDPDADDDGLPDALEAGDDDPATPPVDSDRDGAPDFQDLDSDDNGLADGAGTETAEDLDADGTGDWADVDDDGDQLRDDLELQGAPGSPPDSDGDGAPDYRDEDADGDGIGDVDERAGDDDDDGVPAYLDDDADGDCIPDAIEAGDDDLATAPADADQDGSIDANDIDADGDGLADGAEDPSCDGHLGEGETSPYAADTDGDEVSDLIEVAAGTDGQDPADNPRANGDFVFVVPYQAPPDPASDDLDFSTDLVKVDIYVLADLSGSMQTELDAVRANLARVIDELSCPPAGSGAPGACIPELWSGAGSFTYAGRDPFVNRLRIQPDPDAVGPTIPGPDNGSCPPGGCVEPAWLATWAALTGQGSAASGCAMPAGSFPSRPSCASSAAGPDAVGYPCFRPDALPVVLLATDESPALNFTCPAQGTVIQAARARGAKLLGILGSSFPPQTRVDLEALAEGSGAVTVSGDPLVFEGANADAPAAIQEAIQTLAGSVPFDISAAARDLADDDGDPVEVDAAAAFIARLETLPLGTPLCEGGLDDDDTDGDGLPDRYLGVLPGARLCWSLTPRSNTTVEPTPVPQLYRAAVEVRGDGVSLLDTRDVYFLVPPVLEGPGVD